MKKLRFVIYVAFIFVLFFSFEFFMHGKIKENTINFSVQNFPDEKILDYDSNIKDKLPYAKEVFLTFDDGPCANNTRSILKTLKDNNVKATFFIVGIKGEENPQLLKDISNEGMSLGIHTYSHDYKKMYKDLEGYLHDLHDCNNVIKKITGKNPVPYIRLPGGSTNRVTRKDNLDSIKVALNHKGMKYVDWNVCAGDAESKQVTAEKIKQNIIAQCKNKKLAVILMHDLYYKHVTVEALPAIIQYLKNDGFVFRTFDDLTFAEESEMIRLGIINKS